MNNVTGRNNVNAPFRQPESIKAMDMRTGEITEARRDISLLTKVYKKPSDDNKRKCYAGVDMTDWKFSLDDENLIYKVFIAVCNYAEEYLPCGECPLYKLCFSEAGEKFWNQILEKSESSSDNLKQCNNMNDNTWIPCSERLPENNIDVLVYFEYFRFGNYNRLFKTIGISYTYNGEWSGFVNGSSGWRELNIIAWQPLPKPYDSTKNEDLKSGI